MFHWVMTLKSNMYWVFVKFILGNTTFPIYFLYKTYLFNWVVIISFAFCYPWFKKQFGIPEKNIWIVHQKAAYLYLWV